MKRSDCIVEKLAKLARLNPRWAAWIEKRLRSIPAVRQEIRDRQAGMMRDLEGSLKPYRDSCPGYTHIPAEGIDRQEILDMMKDLSTREEPRWREGYASGAVYHGGRDHIEFLDRVYALNSQANPLHADLWPSTIKYEAEIVAMTAGMLGGESVANAAFVGGQVCGTLTSGGTESILLAMKAYRDQARDRKGITRPQMIIPTTAHAAFDKASQYFGIRAVRIQVDAGFKADVAATRKAITRNTIVIAGSAPSFPHGTIDPIEALSELARQRRIGFHTDACLGGFLLPWAKQLGYDIPPFDFGLPGVTSISADPHKYGYAAKGTSVVLYRGLDLRHYQYFAASDWPGGIYFSPTFAGSRPGALSAACWAAMVTMGEAGYRQATKKILETASWIRSQIDAIPELHVLGDPLWVIAFASQKMDIYRVMEKMTQRRWSLNGLHKPSCVHLCVTSRHAQPGVAARFISDLKLSVDEVERNPQEAGTMAPIYGMAAIMPLRGVVRDLLKSYMDLLYKA